MRASLFICVLAVLAGCQRRPDDQPARKESPQTIAGDLGYWEAPASEFEAVEPTVFGVVGSPAVWDALAPLGRRGLAADETPETLDAHIRVEGEGLVADVLHANLADDAISAEHVRIEFRREPEGWFPTNAYRRHKCRRAREPAAWSTALCP